MTTNTQTGRHAGMSQLNVGGHIAVTAATPGVFRCHWLLFTSRHWQAKNQSTRRCYGQQAGAISHTHCQQRPACSSQTHTLSVAPVDRPIMRSVAICIQWRSQAPKRPTTFLFCKTNILILGQIGRLFKLCKCKKAFSFS